jgi:hypothetical protein
MPQVTSHGIRISYDDKGRGANQRSSSCRAGAVAVASLINLPPGAPHGGAFLPSTGVVMGSRRRPPMISEPATSLRMRSP